MILPLTVCGQQHSHHLLPVPHHLEWKDSVCYIDSSFYVFIDDLSDTRAKKAVHRFMTRLDKRTALLITNNVSESRPNSGSSFLRIQYNRSGELVPGEDESYSLKVSENKIELFAETDLGILYGLETFLQLLSHNSDGFYLPCVEINDQPRFVWRGLLIDVCRHFSPLEVIKRNIDGMLAVKMNVLHLHLSEDQGFRIESKVWPKLHELGSDGKYYTQTQIKELINYASDRGIRVVPEFDMPGHTTSWMVGYPQLASIPGTYSVEKKFGVFDPVMNPARKSTYKFLDKFIKEMSSLFPDDYFHIGGDENNGKQWNESSEITNFKQKNDLKDNHELHNYFNTKLFKIVSKYNKKMIGWDEILQPGLPDDAIIHSWRGKEGLVAAARDGYEVILSNGYYIDLCQPAWKHYMNDPIPVDLELTNEQQKLILGGEATMWAELVTEETIDSRIWPRTAAIAERLWSPRSINNIPDMYRRLEHIEIQLEEHGLQHLRNRDFMIRRLAGTEEISALIKLVEVTEPLKDYARHSQGITYSTDLPLTRLPDIAKPDSKIAREFRLLCERLVKKNDLSATKTIKQYLDEWIENYDEINKNYHDNPALKSWCKMALNLKEASLIGLQCLDFMNRRQIVTEEWTEFTYNKLINVSKPVEESELAVMDSIMMLFQHSLPQ